MTHSTLMDISAARLRALRAALFTALCVTLSAASHVLLSGMALPLATVGTTAAAVFAIAYALAGRERGFGHIAALLVPLELAADAVFTTGQDTCYGSSGHHAPGALSVLCGGGAVGRSLPSGTVPGAGAWLLLAGHIAVALLAAAWLRRGEAALARLLRTLATAAVRPLLLALTALAGLVRPYRAPAPLPRRTRVPLPRAWLHSVVRRGPPPARALAPA
ncbi:hypothetical protein ACFP1Z_23420 [Streptomyces gamaensis]|uniref:Integral membrane protein n=1 Tax=Streptomyces gamaensis TaxID=1763542 RepID=A0ABW0Z7U3_9ACTN